MLFRAMHVMFVFPNGRYSPGLRSDEILSETIFYCR